MPRKHVGVAIFSLKISWNLTTYDVISPYYGNQNIVPMHWRPAICLNLLFFHVTYQALNYLDNLALKLLYMFHNNLIYVISWVTKYSLTLARNFNVDLKFLHVTLQNCRGNLPLQALKDALKNLNTRKSTPRRI